MIGADSDAGIGDPKIAWQLFCKFVVFVIGWLLGGSVVVAIKWIFGQGWRRFDIIPQVC
jgi:hypothetical protein